MMAMAILVIKAQDFIPRSSEEFAELLNGRPMELEPLRNGLFMTKQREAAIASAYWRLLVMLREPKFEPVANNTEAMI